MASTGTKYMPPVRSHPRQSPQYHRAQAHLRHPHFSHPLAPESQGFSPYDVGIELTRSGRRGDGTTGSQQSLYSPQGPTSRLGTPFVDQSTMSEIQRLSACVLDLEELDGQHTREMEQFVTHLNKIESWVDALEAASADGNRTSTKMSAGSSKGGANDTPLLKVSLTHNITHNFCVLTSLLGSGTCDVFSTV
jgi:hypothetical protein